MGDNQRSRQEAVQALPGRGGSLR